MANVSQHVNIDNLTRWFLAVAFSATRDAYQGPGQFLDRTKTTGGWFWVNWDMDQSFRDWNLDSYQYLLERVGEGRRGRNPAEPRSVILTQLIAEDPQYREYFKRVVQKALNHQLTQAFLQERYEHYLTTATQLRVPPARLPAAAAAVSRTAPRLLQTDERAVAELTHRASRSTVTAPANVDVDHRRRTREERLSRDCTFPDLEMTVDVADEHRPGFTGWRVNGRLIPGRAPLKFKAEQATQIEAVFDNRSPAPAVGAPRQTSRRQPLRRRLRVRCGATIPAGESWMGCVPGDDRCDAAEKPRVRSDIRATVPDARPRSVSRTISARSPLRPRGRCRGSPSGTPTAPIRS